MDYTRIVGFILRLKPQVFSSNLYKWLLWDSSSDTPRRPHWRGDFGIAWNEPADWHSFEEAVEAAQDRDSWGVGYVFTPDDDEYMIDVDGPYTDAGDARGWFPDISRFVDAGAYMEWSPSGNGLHIPVEGQPPEWWRDSEVDPDKHQGVDVLTNKFCTFTGDKHAKSGEAVTDTNAAPFLFEAYQNIRGENPSLDDGEEESRDYQGGEWLDDSTVEEALGEIDPDLPHNEWVKLGYAVHDYDSGSVGKSLFESWSKRGEKWDSSAKRSIDAIWNGASSGTGVTVATLVHKAKEAGWNPPARSRDSRPEPPTPTETDGDESSERAVYWEAVREAYEEDGNQSGRVWAAAALEERASWMYVMESETLWVYDADRGYFNPWGEERAASLLEENTGSHFSSHELSEIVTRLEARNQTHRDDLNAKSRDDPLVCVGNGVVNLETGERLEHSPEYQFTRGIPHDYDPDAVPERALRFLRQVTKRDADLWTLLQQLGHGLMPGHPFKAFVVMYGPGDNGKSAVGSLFREFVGDDNAAAVELRDFREDDFATGDLPGKMINVGDDLSGKKIRDVSMLKRLTGGDTLRANQKHQPTFDFTNEAAMFFSGNEPPTFEEKTPALKGRLYPIEMPYRFTQEPNDGHRDADTQLVESIVDDEEEMAGLLNLAIQGARDLIASGGAFEMPETPDERMDKYEAASDPIRRFVMEYLTEAGPDAKVLKDDVYDVYAAMCRAQNERATNADIFKQEVSQQAIVDVESGRTRQLTPGDGQDTCWKYVGFVEEAREHMSERLISRYFPDESEGTESEADDDREDTAFHATPLKTAPDALTGYVTVTAEIVSAMGLGDDGAKAVLKDESGAMDVVAWQGEPVNRLMALEGEPVAIKNAEVREYEGKRQLTAVEGLTEIQEIQQGVGHTGGTAPGDGQGQLDDADARAQADGGKTTRTNGVIDVPADATGPAPNARRVAQWVDEKGPQNRGPLAATVIEQLDLMTLDEYEAALEKGQGELGVLEVEDGEVRSLL